jgi:Icc-related predicted phosphoesterase
MSCGLISIMLINGNCDQSNVDVLVKEFFVKIHEKARGSSEDS